ncbi:MAG: histidine kinase dimerization/phospho-acceptor domain-containing protein, partial [Spirochaetota bacterium]
MSLKSLKGGLKRINFKLTLLFSLIFIASSICLFFLTYGLLSNALSNDLYKDIQLRLLELWAQYQTGGIDLIENEMALEKDIGEKRMIFLRIADSQNRTLLTNIPNRWKNFNYKILEKNHKDQEKRIVELYSEKEKYAIEIASLVLSDGNILQIGMATETRALVLRQFRKIFFIILTPTALFGFVLGMFLSYRLFKPVRNLVLAVRTIINTRKMNTLVPVKNKDDELGELTSLFNTMLEKINTLINGLKNTLDTVAHDLRTPLTRMKSNAEITLRSSADLKACRQALRNCIDESESIHAMLN